MKVFPRTLLGNPILRAQAKKVPLSFLKTSKGKNLIQRMIYTLRETGGVGLAAPQINEPIQLAILQLRPVKKQSGIKPKGPTVVVNPKITYYSKEKIRDWEGCLSFLEFRAQVPRSKHIRVTYVNEEGKKVVEKASGFWARIFQHEIDHLNGIVYLDRVEDMKTVITLSEFKKRILKKKKISKKK